MDVSGLSLFRLIGERLNWLDQRQSVTAENIANVNTPGYRAQDLQPFESHLRRSPGSGDLAPVATHVSHFGVAGGANGAGEGSDTVRRETVRDPVEVKPNGNEVSLDQQIMHVAENATNHELALGLYRKQAGMIRMAIGARGGG